MGDEGFAVFQSERGVADTYTLTAVQADAILRMTLGQLVNLEQEKLGDEHRELLDEITEYLRILSDEQNILAIIREDLLEIKKKHGDERRTEISGEEIGSIDLEDLITEETMVVTISHNGYIKRTPVEHVPRPAPRRQGAERRPDRGGRPDRAPVRRQHARLSAVLHQPRQGLLAEGLRPAAAEPREPRPGGREPAELRRGRKDRRLPARSAISPSPGHYLIMATRKRPGEEDAAGAVQPAEAGRHHRHQPPRRRRAGRRGHRPRRATRSSSRRPTARRFASARRRCGPWAATPAACKGIKLRGGDSVVGMVVADPDATLLTVCEKGYGKRTPFGPNLPADAAAKTRPRPRLGETEAEMPPSPRRPNRKRPTEGDEGEDAAARRPAAIRPRAAAAWACATSRRPSATAR